MLHFWGGMFILKININQILICCYFSPGILNIILITSRKLFDLILTYFVNGSEISDGFLIMTFILGFDRLSP